MKKVMNIFSALLFSSLFVMASSAMESEYRATHKGCTDAFVACNQEGQPKEVCNKALAGCIKEKWGAIRKRGLKDCSTALEACKKGRRVPSNLCEGIYSKCLEANTAHAKAAARAQ